MKIQVVGHSIHVHGHGKVVFETAEPSIPLPSDVTRPQWLVVKDKESTARDNANTQRYDWWRSKGGPMARHREIQERMRKEQRYLEQLVQQRRELSMHRQAVNIAQRLGAKVFQSNMEALENG